MAIYGGYNAVTGTLASASVDTVVLTQPTLHGVRVNNDNAGTPIFWTVCNIGGPSNAPTVNGANCYVTASVGALSTHAPIISATGVVVNLISGGTPTYTVMVDG